MRPAKAVQLGDINELAHGAIRLAGIELNCAFKAYGLDNELRELTDSEFPARTYINQIFGCVTLYFSSTAVAISLF